MMYALLLTAAAIGQQPAEPVVYLVTLENCAPCERLAIEFDLIGQTYEKYDMRDWNRRFPRMRCDIAPTVFAWRRRTDSRGMKFEHPVRANKVVEWIRTR